MACCKHRVMDRCKKSGMPCTFEKHCFEPEEPKIMTNADCIRAMSDEKMAAQLTVDVDGLMDCRLYLSVPTGKMLVSRAEAVRITLDWLRQPAEED